jgi:hypothetical protein
VQNEIVHSPQAAFWKPEAWTSCGSNDSVVLVVYLVEVNGGSHMNSTPLCLGVVSLLCSVSVLIISHKLLYDFHTTEMM